MNNKVLLVVGAILILGVGGYFLLSSKKSPTTNNTSNPGTSQKTGSGGSLKDLIATGISQTCEYTNAGSTGTVYLANGKVRTDFDTTVNGTTTKSHMIVDSGNSYIWMDGQSSGFKTTFNASASASSAPSGSFDVNANLNYTCTVGPVDSSKFALPGGVSFTSFTVPSATTAPTAPPARQYGY